MDDVPPEQVNRRTEGVKFRDREKRCAALIQAFPDELLDVLRLYFRRVHLYGIINFDPAQFLVVAIQPPSAGTLVDTSDCVHPLGS